jgi:trehalose-6-phosphate synthase
VLEYIASRVNEDGAVVLSSLSGAADVLPEAQLVNPNSSDLVAAALRTALEMEPGETRQRMSALRGRLANMDVTRWRREFALRAFGDELEPPAETETSATATM